MIKRMMELMQETGKKTEESNKKLIRNGQK